RRRHTRSDRDWSSDVCSSDLDAAARAAGLAAGAGRPADRRGAAEPDPARLGVVHEVVSPHTACTYASKFATGVARSTPWLRLTRSEERRVGKEGTSRGARVTC